MTYIMRYITSKVILGLKSEHSQDLSAIYNHFDGETIYQCSYAKSHMLLAFGIWGTVSIHISGYVARIT